jgi:hypothetical protein
MEPASKGTCLQFRPLRGQPRFAEAAPWLPFGWGGVASRDHSSRGVGLEWRIRRCGRSRLAQTIHLVISQYRKLSPEYLIPPIGASTAQTGSRRSRGSMSFREAWEVRLSFRRRRAKDARR